MAKDGPEVAMRCQKVVWWWKKTRPRTGFVGLSPLFPPQLDLGKQRRRAQPVQLGQSQSNQSRLGQASGHTSGKSPESIIPQRVATVLCGSGQTGSNQVKPLLPKGGTIALSRGRGMVSRSARHTTVLKAVRREIIPPPAGGYSAGRAWHGC